MEKSIKLVKILSKRRINVACVQETTWIRMAREVNGYKLWDSKRVKNRNGVGILVDEDIRRVNDRIILIKLVIGGFAYTILVLTYRVCAWLKRKRRPFGRF